MRRSRQLVGSVVAALAVSSVPTVAQSTDSARTRTVTLDGRAVRVQVAGLERRKPGSPVVVFEAGATNSLDTWRDVLPHVATAAPVVAYDRAGLGQSAWDSVTPTPRHVTTRLRRLLHQIGVNPPYVLVGHSWGASLMRFFAGYHPAEVVGLVYADPGPIITQSLADEIAPFEKIGKGRAEYEAFWSSYAALIERASPAARAEFGVFRGLMQRDVAERDLMPAPDVPVVMLLAAKPFPPLPGLPFDAAAHFQADLRHRIRMLQEWALASSKGTVVVSNLSTHAVPRDEPDLLVWAVKRVLSASAVRP
ncbi:MAG TPA: alpha/beta hydrolase [Gemmatimonadaceae bacterium]|nr:alpha/beta hydrolase [Gemmatimonadaceae bacterium]